MPNYVRAFRPGGTFFLTIVAERRAPIFANEHSRTLLHDAIEQCRKHRPFWLDAIVLLLDHLHLLMTLPEGDGDFSGRVAYFKSRFTRSYLGAGGVEQPRARSRARQRARAVWQRRFWEHTIRDERDLNLHLDYIHYNPVKHGLVGCPHAWQHSSFHRFVAAGRYDRAWCCQCEGHAVVPLDFGEIADTCGE